MYTFSSKIRYSEVDTTGFLPLHGILNYFQDCSNFQSTALGLDVETLRKKEKAWVFIGWQVEVSRYPLSGEQVTIGTFATGMRGIYAHRNFVMLDEKEDMICKADSRWVMIDLKSGRPIKPTEEDLAPYGTATPLPMEDMGKKIKKAEDTIDQPGFLVLRQHLDTLQHVNNVKYVELALEYIPLEVKPKSLRVEYKKSALLGVEILPSVSYEEERTVVELKGAEKTYAILEFR